VKAACSYARRTAPDKEPPSHTLLLLDRSADIQSGDERYISRDLALVEIARSSDEEGYEKSGSSAESVGV
jgi:hypothetical protein